jgi:hydrogenase maturation protease
MTMTAVPRILVLGIGNILWADEGFGVRAVEELARRYAFPDNVRLEDGGTQGLYLVDLVRDADVLVVFDAVDYGLPAGTLHCVRGDDVPRFMGARKVSLHQTGFQEVLALAGLMGQCPRDLLLIGVQPVELEDFGGSLREPVKAQIEPALAVALEHLAGCGVVARERPDTAHLPDFVHREVSLAVYEAGRPGADVACRIGDERFLPCRPGDSSECA